MNNGVKIKKGVNYVITYIFLGILAFLCLIPFVMMLVNSTRSGMEIMQGFTLIPGDSLKANWKNVTDNLDVGGSMLRSLFVAAASTALSAYFSALTAYAFAFYKFPGSKIIFSILIGFMMIPSTLGLFGFYDLCNTLGMIDTYWPLIIPSIASTGTVFFLKQYAESTIPRSMLEAPRIDGASEMAIFHRIVIPMMAPGIATMSIGAFIGSWNAYLMPLLILNNNNKFTLPLTVAALNAYRDISQNQGAIYLCIAMSVVPILVAFAIFSKYIISSISAGSVKE